MGNLHPQLNNIIKDLQQRGIDVTIDNVRHNSIVSETLPETTDKDLQRDIDVYRTYQYIEIGFCQPKFYKPAAWAKAKRIMNKLCALNIGVIPYDYGRGKGKYTYNGDLDFVDLAELLHPIQS